jgi:tRNA 5-methylaminomethyl-2-thiouridine biosynthesis bifunctional protein
MVPIITIFMKGAPRSEQFDDIYFSAEDGFAETQHVFFNGNDLPAAWQGKDSFTIAETGFGTGLNFLAVWKLFEENSHPSQTLDFISVEKYPLSPNQIREALATWLELLGDRIDILLENYPLRINGFHRIKINEQVTLTLIFDDIAEALPQLNAVVDCWFLDGFTPAKNPEMWNVEVFQQMARLSKTGASFATFTAAGDVRRGLQEVGFVVEKRKGFGHKRDMIAGILAKGGANLPHAIKKGSKVAIIGGGLAGTSCAYVLKQYGYNPIIYEASDRLAAGASGNEVGFYNPRFSKLRDGMSDFYTSAYAQFIRLAKNAGKEINYNPCGALHLMTTSEKLERFKALVSNWGLHRDHVTILDKDEASNAAGITLDCETLYLPDSGSISPNKLCHYYAKDIDVRFNQRIEDLNQLDAEAIIICNASSVASYDCLSWLELETVRGQITKIKASKKTANIKSNIHYGGYLSVAHNDTNVIGATFQKWIDHTDILDEDHDRNLKTMIDAIPSLSDESLTVTQGWAGKRTASKDRFPIVGPVPERDNVYISSAFGSHGIVGSIAAAHYLVDLIRGGPLSLSQNSSKSLLPKRFLDRAKKKHTATY